MAAARGRLGSLPLYGGQACLRHALEDTGAGAVVVVDGGDPDGEHGRALRAHLDRVGALDVYRFEVSVRREG